MTLRQLRKVALKYTPRAARFGDSWLSDDDFEWLPAHELGHAFVADQSQLSQRRFGLHRAYECVCPRDACLVYECAAMYLSGTWAIAVGRLDVMLEEFTPEQTPRFDEIWAPNMRRRARRRLRALGLWPIPVTIEDIIAYAEKKGLRA